MDSITKKCSKCGLEKELNLFIKDNRRPSGYGAQCLDCKRKNSREWVANNYERLLAYSRSRKYDPVKSKIKRDKWLSKGENRHKMYLSGLKSRYGLSKEAYQNMFESQNGLCSICKDGGTLHVDHDHKNGVVRGLVCGKCNRALGLMGDDPLILERAAAYLRDTKK